MNKQQVGVIGMAVMGSNLARNLASRGFSVAIFNRSFLRTQEVIDSHPEASLTPYQHLADFVANIEAPRKIILMVKAGEPTDDTLTALIPLLSIGDIVVDGGNTYFLDTERRAAMLAEHGINFIGTGISGGEEGALRGPSIMPSGDKEAYQHIAPILGKIAAQYEGEPCVTYIGTGGAGHYVKMVHNGIEYGDMQLITEAYALLKYGLKLSNDQMADIFHEWNQGELNSYLIEITADILRKKDPLTGEYLLDVILDAAGNKGTGKWTSQSALDLGVPLSLITESVFARYLSALKEQRIKASRLLSGPVDQQLNGHPNDLIEQIRQGLYLSKIISYAQGFAQLQQASETYQWNLPLGEIAKIFRAGCIIRAQFLQKIAEAYQQGAVLDNLLIAPYFQQAADRYQASLRNITAQAILHGIAVPTFSSAIAYYDSYRSAVLPANLIQAQRDYFGAHTYQRLDREGIYHTTDWQKP
ncbi:MAG: NADP-dependent phosphogluconate dehydrogenase [Plesiomonas sp.]|uniref:NADP-dependent phosphogluconate dehydrogenase n=1 Tax=Plesiomonas sp. TaxID=2486279 RepID=UPI003F2D7267